MRIEWDGRKNHLNRRKHGISFELASLVFADPNCRILPDRIDETGERRWHALGSTGGELRSAILIVVHVYREDHDGEEIIRIISARAANSNEIRRYQAREVDEI